MAGPWEQYQDAAPAEEGPWTRFEGAQPAEKKKSATVPKQRGVLDEIKRQAGLGTRAIARGATSIAGIVTDPIVMSSNALLGTNWATSGQAMDQAADAVGLPAPETGAEQFADKVIGAVGGAGGSVGAGKAVVGGLTGAPRLVAGQFAANPGAQTVAAVSGATAAEGARAAGLGPNGQMIAGLAGGFAPSVTAAGLRGALRGGEQGRQQVIANQETFARAGAGSPTVGQASESRVARSLEALLGRTPGGAGVIARKSETQQAGMGTKAEEIANSLSSRSTAEQAGRAIEKGIKGEGGFVDKFKSKQQELFNRLDEHIPQDERIDISSTKSALDSLNASIPGAPNTSRLFQNGRIAGIGQALEKDLAVSTTEQDALVKALDQIDALYSSRNAATQQAGQLDALAQQQANRTHNFAPVAGMPRVPGRYSPFPERSAQAANAADEARNISRARAAEARGLEAAVADLRAAAQASGGKLPYEAIKKLRTLVGQELADAGMMSDVPRSKWKALYGALSSDLEQAAKNAGPDAQRAFARANNYTKVGMGRLESLDSVIDKNGGPEAVYRAAMSGSREGATTLRAVLQSLPADTQKQLAATVIRRMGRAKPGAQDDLGEAFSSETFLTNFNSMSPEARKALFDRFGPRYINDLKKITDMTALAKTAANRRSGAQVFKNPSSTSDAVIQGTTGGAFALSVLSGNVPVAGGIAGGVTLANVASRAMTSPVSVNWLARQTSIPASQFAQQVRLLEAEAKAKGDEDAMALAELLKSQKPEGQ